MPRSMDKSRVFVDSSVLIAAILSPLGGSSYVLRNFHSFIVFQTNEYVLEEVERILRSKFFRQPYLRTDLFLLLGVSGIEIMPNPPKNQVIAAQKWISRNDAPILASALSRSDYLLTLDNEFFKSDIAALIEREYRTFAVVKPKEFIERIRDSKKEL